MSYAVIQTGGKQYKVKSGEILKIEKLPDLKSETKIEFNDILAYGDNKVIEIGSPTIQGAKVEANLIKSSKNRTVLIFKKRRRQNSNFCILNDSKNSKLKEKILEINEKLDNHVPTVPSILSDELECNIFLKAKDLESFSKLRELKDNF